MPLSASKRWVTSSRGIGPIPQQPGSQRDDPLFSHREGEQPLPGDLQPRATWVRGPQSSSSAHLERRLLHHRPLRDDAPTARKKCCSVEAAGVTKDFLIWMYQSEELMNP
jgi:hypothetical protein